MPEGWDQQQAVFAESLVVLPNLIEGVEPQRLHRAPSPGEWSAHVVLCHLLLDEMNTTMIQAHPHPGLPVPRRDRRGQHLVRDTLRPALSRHEDSSRSL